MGFPDCGGLSLIYSGSPCEPGPISDNINDSVYYYIRLVYIHLYSNMSQI